MRRLKTSLAISTYLTNDPLLQSTIPPLQLTPPPPTLKHSIQLLTQSASHHALLSLSANQIRIKHRMFAILKEEYIIPHQWSGYQHPPQHYEVVINPQLVSETSLKFKDFEECPSIPGMRFAIWNPIRQIYTFHAPNLKSEKLQFQPQRRTLHGFNSRIWDHEVRHLNGILAFAQNISHGEIYVSEEFKENPGMHEMVELMKQEIRLMSTENLKKMMQKATQDSIGSELPQKITKKLKSQLSQQYKRAQEVLTKEKQNISKK